MLKVLTKSFSLPEVDKREALRYAGIRNPSLAGEELMQRFDGAISLIDGKISARVCYCEVDVKDCDFLGSLDIKKNLRNSQSVILFAATVGFDVDRLISRYEILSPATAVLIDAIGSERVEALCDEFCAKIKEEKRAEGFCLRPRFSAGYGDLPIKFQKTLFDLLDPYTHIGVTLNDSYLMTPRKSVTAIIGVEKTEEFQI